MTWRPSHFHPSTRYSIETCSCYFCFPLPGTADRTTISLHLHRGLDTLVVSLPLVKGRIVRRKFHEGAEQRKGFLDLACNTSDVGPQLVVRHLDDDHPDYQQVNQGGFYLHGEENYRLRPCSATCPRGCELSSVLNIQVNFIQGGAILCFAFHHSIRCQVLWEPHSAICRTVLRQSQ
jgi:hypothetical protein